MIFNLLKYPLLICLCSLLIFGNKAHAQDTWYEYVPENEFAEESGVALEFTYGYDMPRGALSLDYQPAPTYGVAILKTINRFTLNFNFDYHEFPVKGRSLGKVDDTFLVLGFYTGASFNKLVTPFFKVYGGVNAGGWFKSYDDMLAAADEYNADAANINFYFAPKAGFTYLTKSRIGIGIEAKYNVYVTGYDYYTGQTGGKLYNSVAATVALSYHF